MRCCGRRADEAELTLRDVIARSAVQGNFRRASGSRAICTTCLKPAAGRRGLSIAEEKAGYTRRRGWGRDRDWRTKRNVCKCSTRWVAAAKCCPGRAAPRKWTRCPKQAGRPAAKLWNDRENLLETGCKAAVVERAARRHWGSTPRSCGSTKYRGRNVGTARTRFNDYGPLLRLRRFEPARQLLVGCRAVFEAERDVSNSAKSTRPGRPGGRTGGRAEAVRFEQIALGYTYQAGQPEDSTSSHNNVANYLEPQGPDPASVLAHRLAAAAMWFQIQSGQCDDPQPRQLHPPRRAAGVCGGGGAGRGDRGRAVCRLVRASAPHRPRRRRRNRRRLATGGGRRLAKGAETQRREDVLASMPTAIRSAIEHEDVAELQAALEQMTPEESQAIIEQLQTVGLIGTHSAPT